jgi:hypothetical protein
MLWRILMLPLWVLKKGLGAVFMVVRLALGILRLIFGRRIIALAVLAGGFFLGKKFLKDKAESETKPE